MSWLSITGFVVMCIGAIFNVASYYGRALSHGLAALLILLGGGYPLLLLLATGSFVNPLAAIWGTHSAWKIASAGFLYGFFPLVLFTISRFARSTSAVKAMQADAQGISLSQKKRVLGARTESALAVIAIPALYFLKQCIYLIRTFTRYPHPVVGAELVARAAEQPWLLQHPSIPIHHTYAGATYLYTTVLGYLVILFALPFARWIVSSSQHPRTLKQGTMVTTVVGLAIGIIGFFVT